MAKPNATPIRPAGRANRCAVYTRKSSEEGLEQDFNSLHAQREACEAYIKSQKHEGWLALSQAYDDGGISGATLERPALQQLLADVAAGKVDTVVVYKVDRLTRTLSDFAKIVEIFDTKQVAFVSVTQQFNTTTSMGRLTLNMLLSFAQFEREVTGERIRDKIAASKKRGLWMGGTPPLGYDVHDRKLLVNEAEAATVRHIFQRYLALRSVRLLREDLKAGGITGKSWTSQTGRPWGGGAIAHGALYRMLQNRIYRGDIVHKDQHYPGEHSPIVDEALWDRVQALLTDNAGKHSTRGRARNPSLLAGLIYDGAGHRMTPTHAVKQGKRYCYYVSHPLIAGEQRSRTDLCRIPAPEVERVVTERLQAFLADGAAVFDAVNTANTTVATQHWLIEQSAALARSWPSHPPARQREILTRSVARIVVASNRVQVHLRPAGLNILFDESAANRATPPAMSDEPVVLTLDVSLKRIGQDTKLIMDTAGASKQPPNPGLVRLLAQAHQMQRRLLQGEHASITAFAQQEQMTGSYVARLIRLAWLAPDIVQAILHGVQPPALTVMTLMLSGPLPMEWREQRRLLGFV